MPRSLNQTSVWAILVLWTAACAGQTEPTGFSIERVTVIDAVHGVRENQTVVVDGDTIIGVYGDSMQPPEVANRIDGSGKFLIPGLWDAHVHLTYDDAFTAMMPRHFLSYGITSIRDTGGLLHKLLPVVESMRQEGAVAPRVFFSGPLLDGASVVYDGEARPELGTSNPSPEAARANVAHLKAQGVDFIKIYELVAPEVFAALVDAAHANALPVAAHVPLSMTAGEVAPRVHSMEHLRNIELACASNATDLLRTRREILASHASESGYALRSKLHGLQRLAAVDAYDATRCETVLASMTSTLQVPTLRLNGLPLFPPFQRTDWPRALDRVPEAVAAPWREATRQWLEAPPASDTTFAAWSLSLVRAMHARGIPIGAGTDTPIAYAIPGYSLHSELEMLVRAGLPPLEALRAATLRPAEFFALDDEMGTIEAGKRADLVLLSANPLENIAHTRRIEAVISKGRLLETGPIDP